MTVAELTMALMAILPGPGVQARVQALAPILLDEARQADVDPVLAGAVAAKESSYRNHIVGRRGEVGVMQIKLTGRAASLCPAELSKLRDLRMNVRCGLRLLKRALTVCGGNVAHALSHYNGNACVDSQYARRVLAMLMRRKLAQGH